MTQEEIFPSTTWLCKLKLEHIWIKLQSEWKLPRTEQQQITFNTVEKKLPQQSNPWPWNNNIKSQKKFQTSHWNTKYSSVTMDHCHCGNSDTTTGCGKYTYNWKYIFTDIWPFQHGDEDIRQGKMEWCYVTLTVILYWAYINNTK